MFQPFLRSLRLLRPRQRLIFYTLTIARVIINLLDVLGLLAIGLLGAMLASGLDSRSDATFFGFSVEIESTETYLWVVLGVTGFFLTKSVLATALLRLTSAFLARAEGKTATEAADYIYSGGLQRVREYSRGDLQFALTLSSQYGMTGLLMAGAAIAAEGALFFSVVIVFFFVDPTTAGLVSLYFLILVGSYQLLVARRLKRLGDRLAISAVGATNSIQDLTSAYREISVFSRRAFFIGRFADFRNSYAKDMALQKFLTGVPRFFVETGLMLGVLGLIAWQFWRGNVSEGLVTTAVFLAGGVRMMAALLPLQTAVADITLMGPQAQMSQELVKASQADSSPSTQPSPADKTELAAVPEPQAGHAVELASVSFTYPDSSDSVIDNVSLTIPSGSHVAIVGPSGAGKTTLVEIILGVSRQSSGDVFVSGERPEKIRQHSPGDIAYVPQNPGLVSGTVAENVALGIPVGDIDEDQVWRALKLANLDQHVSTLPNGIFSDLGKQSDGLSGGQKQRLGLARALYPSPRLLILDEATSALDAGSEAHISETISQLGNETTVLIVAHRLSTIQGADRVFVLEEGRLTAQGTFAEVRKAVPLIEEYVKLMSFGQEPK